MVTTDLIQLLKALSFYDNDSLALWNKKKELIEAFEQLAQTDENFFSTLAAELPKLFALQKMECMPFALAAILEQMPQKAAQKLAKQFINTLKNEEGLIAYLLFSEIGNRGLYEKIQNDELVNKSTLAKLPVDIDEKTILSYIQSQKINWNSSQTGMPTVVGTLGELNSLSVTEFQSKLSTALEAEPDTNPLYWGLTWANLASNTYANRINKSKTKASKKIVFDNWQKQLSKCRKISDEVVVLIDFSGSQFSSEGIPSSAPEVERIHVALVEMLQIMAVCKNVRVFMTACNMQEVPKEWLKKEPEELMTFLYQKPSVKREAMLPLKGGAYPELGYDGIYIKRSIKQLEQLYKKEKLTRPKLLLILSDSGDCDGYNPKSKENIQFAEKQIVYNVCYSKYNRFSDTYVKAPNVYVNPSFPEGYFEGLSSNLLEYMCYILDVPNAYAKGGRLGKIL